MSELHGKSASAIDFQSLVEAFDDVVTDHPDKPALIQQNGTVIAFKDLHRRSLDIANKLDALCRSRISGSSGASNYAILAMSPSVERICCILALWRLNLAYVPVEKCVPRNRIKLMIREVGPRFVLADEVLAVQFAYSDVYNEGLNLVVKFKDLEKQPNPDKEGLEKVAANHAASLLYTSGSTGEPKGVLLTHQNILSRLQWQWHEFPVQANDVGIAKTSLLFVDSIAETWCFLLEGKPVVVLETGARDVQTLLQVVMEHRVSRIVVVPSLLQSLLQCVGMISSADEELGSLREVICSGERLPKILAEEFFDNFPGKILMNFYGSTEVTGDATFVTFQSMKDVNTFTSNGMMSIGKPIDGVSIRIQDETGDLVEDGEIGQIVVSGPTVSPGFLETKTNDDFVTKYYETGDYGRIFNGHLIFEGRSDDQVKIRGNRINAEEVRRKLQKELEVDVVVIVMKPETPDAELVAFVVGNEETKRKAAELCESSLPAYMTPNILAVESIPLTPSTQKTDRQVLKQVYQDSKSQGALEQLPETAQKFLSVLCEELDIPKRSVDMKRHFSSLGGNSINKIRLDAALKDKAYVFNYSDFLLAETVEEMFQCLSLNGTKQKAPTAYKIEMLQTDDQSIRNELIEIFTDSFLTKDPFIISCNFERAEYYVLAQIYYDFAFHDNGIFTIKDTNGRIVAVIYAFDVAKLQPERFPESFMRILAVLEECEKALKESVPDGEPVLDYFGWATIPSLSAVENLQLTEMAEKFMVDVGRERGFYAIQAININPVTQVLATSLGYVTKHSFRLKDYTRPDGTKPFNDVPHDVNIIAQIKFLRENE